MIKILLKIVFFTLVKLNGKKMERSHYTILFVITSEYATKRKMESYGKVK